MDAAIIFADLLLPVEPMGLKLRFSAGEGPVIDNPVRNSSDVDSLSISNTDDLGYVGETIQRVSAALAGRVPVIGFVGAPFTMASYMIEGRTVEELPAYQADDVSRRNVVASFDGANLWTCWAPLR